MATVPTDVASRRPANLPVVIDGSAWERVIDGFAWERFRAVHGGPSLDLVLLVILSMFGLAGLAGFALALLTA